MIQKMDDGNIEDSAKTMTIEENENNHQNHDQNNHNNTNELDIIDDSNEGLESMVQHASQEYTDLNNTLDQIDSWMTNLEEQNDSLYTKIQELLESSKQTRIEIQQENAKKQQQPHSSQNDQPQQ